MPSGTEIFVNELNVQVERKSIKHIHLAVYPPDGHVHVSAPQEATDNQLRLYLLSKWVWICEQRDKVTSYETQPEREFVSGETHYYFGDKYRFKLVVQHDEIQNVRIDSDYIVVTCRKRENASELLREWYRSELKERLDRLVERWKEKIGVEPTQWEVREMPRRWGSASKTTGKILFNLELAKKSIDCIEYVVVHELIHLVERNHTPRFFRILATHLPDWEERKNRLNNL